MNQRDKNGKAYGPWEVRYANGQLWYKVGYKNGTSHGFLESYHFSNGQIWRKGEYKQGKNIGLWYDSKYNY